MRETKLTRRGFITSLLTAGALGNGIIAKPIFRGRDEKLKIKGYRTLGRTGFKVSDIGCGPGLISDPVLLRAVLDSGVNFINATEAYGKAKEAMIGEVIKDYNRKSLFITCMVGIKKNETQAQIVAKAQDSMARMKTDYADCLMIHDAASAKEIKNEEFHRAAAQLKAEGKVKSLGVSCHGASWYRTPEDSMEAILGTAIEDGRFDLLLLVYNYIQREAGERILKACRAKNIATTLMKSNPFAGYVNWALELGDQYRNEGKEIPDWLKTVEEKYKQRRAKAEPFLRKHNWTSESEIRDGAIRFALSNPDVHCVLITFRNFNDVDNYVRLSGTRLSSTDLNQLNAHSQVRGQLYCRHACGICEPSCPHGVPVNTIMRYNHYFTAQNCEKDAIQRYTALQGPKAELCADCVGHCQNNCPYGVPIQALLNIAHANLTLA